METASEFEIKDIMYKDREFSDYIALNFNKLVKYAYARLCESKGKSNINLDSAYDLVADMTLKFCSGEENLDIHINEVEVTEDRIGYILFKYIRKASRSDKYKLGYFGDNTGMVTLEVMLNKNQTDDEENLNFFENIEGTNSDIEYIETSLDYKGAVAVCLEYFESRERKLDFVSWFKALMISSSEYGHEIEHILRKGYEDLFVNKEFMDSLVCLAKAFRLGINCEVVNE